MNRQRPRWTILRAALLPFRLLALLALLAVLAAGLGAAALKFFVTPEQIQSVLAAQLQELFQRPVQIRDVQVLWLQGIRVRGLRVVEGPGFPGGELLSSEIAVARYRWRSLLDKRLDFSEVRLIAPRIELVRRQDGEWNVAGLLRAPRAAPKLAFPFPVSLNADVIAVEDAEVRVRDLQRRRQVTVKGFNLQVRDFSVAKPFSFNSFFETASNLNGKQVRVKAQVHGSVNLASFRWPDAWLEAERVRISADGELVTASGRVRGFAAPAFEARLRLPRLTSANLGRYAAVPPGIAIPPMAVSLRARMPQPGLFVLQSFDAAAEPLRLRASGSLRLGEEAAYRITASVPEAGLDHIAALWSGWAKRRFAGTVEGSVTASGTLGADERPVIESLSLRLRDFAAVLSSDARISGGELIVSAKKNLEDLRIVAPRGRLVAYTNSFSDIDLALRVEGGDLDVERLALTWGISHVKLKGRVERLSSPKSVQVQGSVDKLALQEAINAVTAVVQQIRASRPPGVRPSPPSEGKWSRIFKYSIPKTFPATSGNIKIGQVVHPNFETSNLELLWSLQGIATGLDHANGRIRAGFGPGRVSNIPELEKGSKILRAIFLPFVYMQKLRNSTNLSVATLYPKTLDFTRIYGQYGLQDGVLDIGAFHVDSGQLVAFANGSVDFPKERVGLHILTRLTTSRDPLPEYLTDEKGRPSIGFFVKDDLNKPTLEVDMHKMGAHAIEDALQEALKKGQ